MLRVGITGGIGSGKSTVARIFEVFGIPVYYADEAARRLMNTDKGLRDILVHHFGEETYVKEELNRAYLSSIVFSNPEKLALLNSLTHPATIDDADRWMKEQSSAYVIKEAALLYETDAHKHLDHIIGVSAPLALRIQRVMERDNITEEEVLKRMNRQMAEEEKMKLCDSIIINDEKELLIPQALRLHRRFSEM
ncbi:MAG: dephospho-CoA kinase [Chitinophagaceae bacterium]|nr:dephospho-CoA kinase [Chitinophagaceae bacterium]